MAIDFDLFRSRLEQERKRLTEELEKLQGSDNSIVEREGSWFGERDEQANEATVLRQRLSSEEHLVDLLAKVNHALHKFDEGTYGLCDNCGQSIDPARLEALPQANLCLRCKAQQAKNAKGKLSSG
jgi:RNA polymerase-binding protein DksA